jgi:hypothetical protein
MMDHDACAGCGEFEVESVFPCVMCSEARFCTPECCWDNFDGHMDECVACTRAREEIETRIPPTPRSVYDAHVFGRIAGDRELRKALLLRYQIGQLTHGSAGVMVLRVGDPEGLCVLLKNSRRDPAAIIGEMTQFETCASLMRVHPIISGARMRLRATDKVVCNRFLYCVIVAQTKVLCKIYRVRPPPHFESESSRSRRIVNETTSVL